MGSDTVTRPSAHDTVMTAWIGSIFESDVGWTHLESLVDVGNRMAGSKGEREAAELTRDALAAAGARDARLESFEIQGWTRGDSAITAGDTTQDCIALPRSPDDRVTGPLVDLGYGLPADFETTDLEGAIVMVRSDVPDYYDRYLHRREKYYHAVENGAVGFIYRNHVEGCLPPTGSVGSAERRSADTDSRTESDETDADPIGELPAVGVSSEVGARLARRFDGEQITLAVEADIHPAESQNVHAELGPDTDERILVTSHVDAHDIAEGAMDNGAGTAMVVELANALAAREDDLETRVEFVAFGAEEVGLVGSTRYAEAADSDAIKAVVNNDGVVNARTLEFVTHGFDALAAVADEVAERYDHPIETVPTLGPHSDHWPFVVEGVPGCYVKSVSEGAGRGWGHTFADTIEKLEPRTLREQAILLTASIVALAREDVTVDHRTPEDIAVDLEAQDLAEGMKITGDWPYDE
ncbi:Zn-dependent amino-or carboxypeptidase, M28 family [Natrinema hispanicum]|uniref:Carboxypeptidase Q n=2 Tax=Natrinema hispanicum TaxID=392421 RepID=A0A1G6JXK2_9EURY|nr:Zn-dependent amino-or carboxypeptidase, M28 family [Natrinema hispanicum]SES71694.1 Zn-dependent amino-or carboxypeptidase, M28 family [Natrinema hispanicum]